MDRRLATEELHSNKPAHHISKGTMLELLRYPNMRRKFCILTFLWLANSVAYNGLSYNSSNLGVSDTLAFFINAIVEAPAYILTWWAMGKWGRRWPVCLTMLLGGLACCCCMLVPEGKVFDYLDKHLRSRTSANDTLTKILRSFRNVFKVTCSLSCISDNLLKVFT